MSKKDSRPKTLFCDIDGTLIKHRKPTDVSRSKVNILPKTIETLLHLDKLGYNIILTTGRKESLRKTTEEELTKAGIIYDKLVTGIGGGDRILINDKKPDGRKTAWSIVPDRDEGLSKACFENLSELSLAYFRLWEKKKTDLVGKMFAEDVELKDWNTQCKGKDQVLKANQLIFDSVEKLSVEVHGICHQGNTTFCQITVRANEEKIPVVDIIKYDKNAKIVSITAYRGN